MAYLTILIMWTASAQYAQLSDEHYSIHFPEESLTDVRIIPGTDTRFQGLTFSTDYAMMSWVQIQENPSDEWGNIWRIEHSGTWTQANKHPSCGWNSLTNRFAFTAGTTNDQHTFVYVPVAGATFPLWVHISIRACTSTGKLKGCFWKWELGALQCYETSASGQFFAFDTDSTVRIGSNGTGGKSAKMQVQDLRYYSGTCLTDNEIEAIPIGTNCHSSCQSTWWGPSQYSCGEFLTLVDPKAETFLDTWQDEGSSYKKWGANDSFLMGRTFNSPDIAFTAWTLNQYSWDTYNRYYWSAANDDWSVGETWQMPNMTFQQNVGRYMHCHGNSDMTYNVACVTAWAPVVTNTWQFVVGSSCTSVPELHACYGNISGGMNCVTAAASVNSSRFSQGGSDANIWLGGKWIGGPKTTFKDVRYYLASCLNSSEMAAIKDSFTCIDNCEIWSDPETCTQCITGWNLQLGVCVYTGCTSSEYIKNGSCVTDCGDDYWEQNSDSSCQPCDACCKDCYGSTNTQCTVCNSGCYLQPAPTADTCLTSCPTGYYIDNGCQACHTSCASCSNDGNQDCLTCNVGDYQVQTGACASAWPSNTVSDSQYVCQACHVSCATCSNTGSQDCITCASGYAMDSDDLCSLCHNTCSTCSNTGPQDWTTCSTGYLTPEGSCESLCPSGYANDQQNICVTCHETCATCSSTEIEDCDTCIDGWRRKNEEAQSDACLCDMPVHENSTISLMIACLNAPFTQVTLDDSQKLVIFNHIAQQPNLTTVNLDKIIDITDDLLQFEDTQVQSDFNQALNQAWIVAIDNSGQQSYSYSKDSVEVYLERSSVGSFVYAELLTDSGSGLILNGLNEVVFRDDIGQFNVLSYDVNKMKYTNDTLIGQILSIEFLYLDDNIWYEVPLKNLENNVTIVFDGLQLNSTLTYECVYLLSNYTWSTEGCYLSHQLDETAHCSCNHLSQFSLRPFTSSAQVNSNIEATVQIDNLKNFEIQNSLPPIVWLGAIYTLYIICLIVFLKLDKATEIIKKAEFVRARTEFLRSQTNALQNVLSSRRSIVPTNGELLSSNERYQSPDGSSSSEQFNMSAFQAELIDQMVFVDIEQQAIASVYSKASTTIVPQVGTASSPGQKVKTARNSIKSSRTDQENLVKWEPDAEDNHVDAKEEHKEPPKVPTFKSVFLEEHQVFGMLFVKHGLVSRAEKLTIILVLLMTELFAIGLFYDSGRNPDTEETEEDKTVEETVRNFGWRDFWITLYVLAIVIPIQIILKYLFTRIELNPEAEMEETRKVKKCMKIKRVIGYFMCFAVCAWCTWSIIMFSIEFGHNTAQIWIINFGITTTGDILCKDTILALIMAFFGLYLPFVKERCKKRNNKYKVDDCKSFSEVR